MSRHLGASILLASKDPDRLRSFYSEAFGVGPDQYHAIDLGGLGIIFDTRDDIAERQRANPKVPDRMMQIENEGETAYQRCYGERAPKEKGFAELVRQAQAIADALPAE